MLSRCPRCGLANTLATSTCRSCGYNLSGVAGLPVPAARVPATPVRAPGVSWWGDLLGWKTIEGRVISMDPVYLARPDFDWSKLVWKLLLLTTLFLLVAPLLIGFVLCALVITLILSLLSPHSKKGSMGLVSKVAHHSLGLFFSTGKDKSTADIPVRDFRLMSVLGDEYLVRIKGEIVTGSINVGDELTVIGADNRGTLMFRRGWNQRIRSEIRVKQQ